jgi:hypothetical protein
MKKFLIGLGITGIIILTISGLAFLSIFLMPYMDE